MSWNIKTPGEYINGPLTVNGSATVTGDLTVDTNTLKVDSTNNRVGIGTASPAAPLNIGTAVSRHFLVNGQTTGSSYGEITTTGGDAIYGVVDAAAGLFTGAIANASFFGTGNATSLQLVTNSISRAVIDSSGNLGLGVTPGTWGSTYRAFQIGTHSSFVGVTNDTQTHISTNARFDGTNWLYIATSPASRYNQADNIHKWFTAPSGTAGNAITFTQAMTLDANNRLLLGTTTGGVGNSSSAIFTAKGASDTYFSIIAAGGEELLLTSQAGVNKIGSFTNNRFEIIQGNATRATFDTSGNFIPLLTATAPALGTNSQMVFNLTSNTNLRISVRGTDGTTRTANITLA